MRIIEIKLANRNLHYITNLMPQENFSAPRGIGNFLRRTKPHGVSLSRHILTQVMDGLCKNFPPKKKAKK